MTRARLSKRCRVPSDSTMKGAIISRGPFGITRNTSSLADFVFVHQKQLSTQVGDAASERWMDKGEHGMEPVACGRATESATVGLCLADCQTRVSDPPVGQDSV